MRIKSDDIRRSEIPTKFIVYSIDGSIYQVFAQTLAGEALLLGDDGQILRWRNLQSVRDFLRQLSVSEVILRQNSAYDEMIGQPVSELPNTLELPLSLDDYPDLQAQGAASQDTPRQ